MMCLPETIERSEKSTPRREKGTDYESSRCLSPFPGARASLRGVCPLFLAAILLFLAASPSLAQAADQIYTNGQIVTVDPAFSIQQAFAVSGDRILAVGSNNEVHAVRGPKTQVIDLGGKMVLPGLIDSHTHPTGASLTEFDHPIPEMETIQDVLDYIRARAEALGPGEWVVVRQVFITRLKERRYPTREPNSTAVAPENPVLFSTGPDASLNSLGPSDSAASTRISPPMGPARSRTTPTPANRPASSATSRAT